MSNAVVIVGGGTVGLLLAYELGLAGVEPVLIERSERDGLLAPGLALNSGAVEVLTLRGFIEPLRAHGIEFPAAQFAYLWLDPTKLTDPHPYTFGVPQTLLERHLREALDKLGVDVRVGQEVVGLTQEADEVVVEVRSDAGRQSIRCGYVVGCDGVNSTVRELAGIDFPGEEFPFYGIHGEVEVPLDGPLLGHLQPKAYPAGSFIVSPPDPEVIRILTGQSEAPADGRVTLRVLSSEFGVTPPDPDAPPTVDELRAQAKRITGKDVEMPAPKWLSRWNHAVRQATHYRSGRVFLAGDAAHVHFPLGGRALSTCLEDAINLGWKLAAEINGWAPDGLLDTYHAERHPAGARACMTTQAQVNLLHPPERAAAIREILTELIDFENVNEYFVKMSAGLEVQYPMEYPDETRPHPLMGRRLPNFELQGSTGPADVAGLLHGGRGVLLDLSGRAVQAPDVSAWAGRVDVVEAAPTPAIDASVLLLRPDGRVAWAARTITEPAGLRAALGRWFGAAGPGA